METLMIPFSPRFIILTICCVVTVLLIGIGIVDHKVIKIVIIPILIFGGLSLLGFRDLLQQNHAVLRNYPISAHIRFLLEEIRPEMRQYFFESEKDGMPFSRDTRSADLSARENGARQAAVRHPGEHLRSRATNGCIIRWRRGRMRKKNSASPSAVRIAQNRIRHRCSTSRR